MSPLPRPLTVVCHDAGAANLIGAWLPQLADSRTRLVLTGPARMTSAAQSPGTRMDDLEQALNGAACVLSGSGWASDLEHAARVGARARGIRSVAVLDHWVNYPERFVRAGVRQMPDEIWVTDEDALRIATAAFPDVPVALQPNTYLEETVSRVALVPPHGDLLVLMEPARSNWGRSQPGEFQALDYLLENLSGIGLPPGTRMRLRPHPSDPPGKYNDWCRASGRVVIDDHDGLEGALSPARWVAGCETAALVVAMAAGREVISILPPWAPRCRLPQRQIRHLQHMVHAP
ncbi:hypothetical protein [Tibeticola sp.]|uniref:hypothetical protein n=1 Tax=Tibeticola sp. TaxID=2005368 RepID=UPI0025E7E81A|nr:hypothetical protein [Tibeticola sp.]